MSEREKKAQIWPIFFISAIILAAVIIVAGCRKKRSEPPQTTHQQQEQEEQQQRRQEQPSPEVAAEKTSEPAKVDAEPSVSPKLSLNDVIRAARTWQPAYTSWYGKMAPDFTLTDITGKQHKLSDYRGKNVMIIFWATWCRYCIPEIPHLIALRNTISEDKLAILAISYISVMPPETTETVKDFVKKNKRINYPVFSTDPRAMPAPFNSVNSIPSSFFIDPEGKIKLATAGLLTLGYMKAILQAE